MSGLRSSSALVATALMALALATQAQESDEMAGAWLMHEVRPWAETEPLEDRLRPAEVASGGVSAQAGSSNTCIRESARCPYPIARTNYDTGRSEGHSGWQQRYIDNKNRVEKGGCELDVVWYGDSIVEYWAERAGSVWRDYMEQAGFRSTWAGIAGDTSANLLYRITHGEFPDRIYPKVVVISIGIVDLVRAANRDLEDGNNRARIVTNAMENVRDMIAYIRSRACETQVVITSVLTCGDGGDDDENYDWPSRFSRGIEEINAAYADLASREEKVTFVSCIDRFINRRQIDGNLMPDTVHPSVNGYKVLADCVSRVVRPLALGDTRKISLRGLR
eukprot:jgi/Tetstr1/465686/TSEL_010328.t1